MPLQVGRFHEKGGDDVPVTDGGTNASDATNARTNLGISVYDASTLGTAHASIDHTGLTGIPETGFVVLDSTATMSDINTAINTSGVETVYLRPGQYTFTAFTPINIPDGKNLIGLRTQAGSVSASAQVYWLMNVSFTSSIINSGGSGVTVKNISIHRGSGNWNNGTMLSFSGSSDDITILENIYIRSFNTGSASAGPAVGVSGYCYLRNVIVDTCDDSTLYSIQWIGSNTNKVMSTIENCSVIASGSGTGHSAFYIDGEHIMVKNCLAHNNSGYGFRFTNNFHGMLLSCKATSNGNFGFYQNTVGGEGTSIIFCTAFANQGGYNTSGVSPTDSGYFACNYGPAAVNNAIGNVVPGGWNVHNNIL